MIDKFVIKSSLVKLKSLGFDNCDLREVVAVDEIGASYYLKFGYNDYSFYMFLPELITDTFSFEEHISKPLEYCLSNFENSSKNPIVLYNFVKYQIMSKVCFDEKREFFFPVESLNEFTREILHKYKSAQDFMQNIENIDFQRVIDAEEEV